MRVVLPNPDSPVRKAQKRVSRSTSITRKRHDPLEPGQDLLTDYHQREMGSSLIDNLMPLEQYISLSVQPIWMSCDAIQPDLGDYIAVSAHRLPL